MTVDGPGPDQRWWEGSPEERYWLELSYRTDFGVDLHAPEFDERGAPHHSYFLIQDVRPGDVVFHYSMGSQSIASWSRVTGIAVRDEIYWGTTAGPASTRPEAHSRPGFRVGLEGDFPVQPPVTLGDLRAKEVAIAAAREAIKSNAEGTVYFPFELSKLRPLRPAQFYIAKLPRALVGLYPPLAAAAEQARATDVGGTVVAPPLTTAAVTGHVGRDYRSRPAPQRSSKADPWSLDPDVLDRGRTGHWQTLEDLVAAVRSAGWLPREAQSDEPQFDLAWEANGVTYVAEVKSLTKRNQESQLRLGLGQVLRYRHLLAAGTGRPVRAVLAVETEPSDSGWSALCSSLDVSLVWSGAIDMQVVTRERQL